MDSNLSYRGTKAQDFRGIPGTFFVPPMRSHTPPAAMLWLSRLDTEGNRSCALRSRLGARCSALSCTISASIRRTPARGAARCRAKIRCGHGPVMLQACSGARRNRS